MNDSFKLSFSKAFFGASFLLIVLSFIGAISEDAMFLQLTKPLFVPVFLVFFFIKNKRISIPLILFLLYSFLGDSASMFFSNETFLKASGVMYFLSYLSLVIFVAPKFNYSSLNKLVATYLVIIVLINLYFLYTIYGLLITVIPDSVEVFLFGAKGVSLILLLFIAFGVYLNAETNLSIFFLLMAICFAFSEILSYVNQYYVYHWALSLIDRVMHVFGLFFLFNYILIYNRLTKNAAIYNNEIKAEKILA